MDDFGEAVAIVVAILVVGSLFAGALYITHQMKETPYEKCQETCHYRIYGQSNQIEANSQVIECLSICNEVLIVEDSRCLQQ